MAAPSVPPDLPAALWTRVRYGARFTTLARRPADGVPLLAICAPLQDLADLVGGSPAVWTDLDDPGRLAGPRLILLALPEDRSRLADRLDGAITGGGEWPFACSPDLSSPVTREACARIAEDGRLHVVLCDSREGDVVSRLAFQVAPETVETLRRLAARAAERWPDGRSL